MNIGGWCCQVEQWSRSLPADPSRRYVMQFQAIRITVSYVARTIMSEIKPTWLNYWIPVQGEQSKEMSLVKLVLTDLFHGHFSNHTGTQKPAVETAQSVNYTLAPNMKLSLSVTIHLNNSDDKS